MEFSKLAPKKKPEQAPAETASHPDPNGHTLAVLGQESPAIAAPGVVVDSTDTKIPKAQKTTGEKFYDTLQFSVGKVLILVATAGLGYVAKYGKNSYGGVPNVLKKFQTWTHEKLLHNSVMPLAEKGEFGQRLAGAFSNTCTLFWGGTAFGPIMKSMENNHENIVNAVNKKWGKPGEVEIAHERLKDDPQQTWGDLAKGRIAAWSLVFTSFMGVDTLLGKNKDGLHWFDWYEEKFARWASGFSKTGKDIAKVPVNQVLSEAQDANKFYRFAKISALDIYATSAAIIIWTAVSRMSAKKRQAAKEAENKEALATPAPVTETPVVAAAAAPAEPHEKLFTDTISPATLDIAHKKIRPEKFADAVSTQKKPAAEPALQFSV